MTDKDYKKWYEDVSEENEQLREQVDRLRGTLKLVDDRKENLTLRDQFAMSALIGLLADQTVGIPRATDVANWSYEIADAMMKQREK